MKNQKTESLKLNYKPEINNQLNWDEISPNSNYSLTHLIRKIPKAKMKLKLPAFPRLNQTFQDANPYSTWINTNRWWSQLGTLTDYMIRKFLHTSYPDFIFSEPILLAEKTNHILDIIEQQNADIKIILSKTLKLRHASILIYKDIKDFFPLIKAGIIMVNLDNIRRLGIGRKNDEFIINQPAFTNLIKKVWTLSDSQIQELIPFFENIQKFVIRSFKPSKICLLNPVLGNLTFFKGDADFILDDTLWEIKTVKDPKKNFSQYIYQLFGYCAMQTYLQAFQDQQENISASKYESLKATRINKIGIFFSKQLETFIFDIKDWSDDARLKFLHFLSFYSI
jgi:hypothetical protein